MGNKHSAPSAPGRITNRRKSDLKLAPTTQQAVALQEPKRTHHEQSDKSQLKHDDSQTELHMMVQTSQKTKNGNATPEGSVCGGGLAISDEKLSIKLSAAKIQRAKSALPPIRNAFSGGQLIGRSKSMPVVLHRRADINLDDETIAETLKLQANLKESIAKLKSTSLPEADIDKFSESCDAFVVGKQCLTGVPGTEREVSGLLPSHVFVSCIKGLKGAADRSPNQDNYSYFKIQNYEFFTLQDGHGPSGHIISYRGVRTLPMLVFKSAHFPNNMREALIEGFKRCHDDLVRNSVEQGFDVQISGAACVMLIRKEQTVWLSHTGDSRIVLGTRKCPDVIAETKDHKPTNPEELARITSAGSEVQTFTFENNVAISRVFVKGTDYPGLCMSRSIGDASVKNHGVPPYPEVKQLEITPGVTFCVLASDGVWEFISSELVCSSLSKKLDTESPQKCTSRIITESKKRWKNNEGNYCDDITAMLLTF
jgi:serine/threonine protein phosphatase PrpC